MKRSQKLQTLKLNRETLCALSGNKLLAVVGGISLRCEGTTACTASCGPNTCAYSCPGGYICG